MYFRRFAKSTRYHLCQILQNNLHPKEHLGRQFQSHLVSHQASPPIQRSQAATIWPDPSLSWQKGVPESFFVSRSVLAHHRYTPLIQVILRISHCHPHVTIAKSPTFALHLNVCAILPPPLLIDYSAASLIFFDEGESIIHPPCIRIFHQASIPPLPYVLSPMPQLICNRTYNKNNDYPTFSHICADSITCRLEPSSG